ncbi:MAG TPA: nucleotide exchange factor GrpE [Candidatus Acidoferrales bacterium]|nr:nucleotide exchange factor GrpE [Candidatus Acidoferrales bacterium]
MKKADSHGHKTEAAPALTATVAPKAEAATTAPEITPDQLAELKTRADKADEHWDRLLRTAADFENFKKRAARERHDAAQSATAALVHKLLPVLDHFEMAQAAVRNAPAPPNGTAALQDGIAMIQQQLKGILAETGLEEVDASGRPFDPTLHEAVSQMETSEVPEGHVVQQIRKGYKLRDRLLRPATVVVAKKPSAPPAA